MKGLLDKVFAGKKGVANVLLETLGGSAELVRVGEQGKYHPETDTYDSTPNEALTISFAPETVKKNVLTHVDGVQILAGDLVGVTTAMAIDRPIRNNIDQIILDGTAYLIVSTEMIRSGNETVMIRILARKQ
jgi:hypothetical protein